MAEDDNLATEQLKKRLGRNIAAYRKALRLTQDQLAELLGVEMETVSRFERGKTVPSISTLIKVAGCLKVTTASLLEENEPGLAEEERQLLGSLAALPEDKRRFVVGHLLELCRHLDI